MNKWTISLALMIFLSGCQAPAIDPFTVTDFKNEEPIQIAVSDIHIENNTVRYHELPHIETRMPMTPAYALERALNNRFQGIAPSSPNTLAFIIQKADMTQKKQESDHWYILNNSEFLLNYQVDVIYMNRDSVVEKQEIIGWEKQALPKRNSLAEKEAAWRKMLDNMIQKVVDKIQTDIPFDLRQ